jgi:hypothetical protein
MVRLRMKNGVLAIVNPVPPEGRPRVVSGKRGVSFRRQDKGQGVPSARAAICHLGKQNGYEKARGSDAPAFPAQRASLQFGPGNPVADGLEWAGRDYPLENDTRFHRPPVVSGAAGWKNARIFNGAFPIIAADIGEKMIKADVHRL